jgi:hypothetical protein
MRPARHPQFSEIFGLTGNSGCPSVLFTNKNCCLRFLSSSVCYDNNTVYSLHESVA